MVELALLQLGENSQIGIRTTRSPDRASGFRECCLLKVGRELERESQ